MGTRLNISSVWFSPFVLVAVAACVAGCPEGLPGIGPPVGYVAPECAVIPPVAVVKGETNMSLDLDDYVSDVDHSDEEITWAFSGNVNVTITVDPVTRVVTFGATGGWLGTETITFTATDPTDLYDQTTVEISVVKDQYELGFHDGFAEDDWYWQGFYDSYDTVDFGPIYYQGDTIPIVSRPEYDSGYWDGVWWAYSDGYFVCYRYSFIVGFSEGYDNAFWPDYLEFLANDVHIEYLDGGWSDGYNDGFSEGRVFGANDYESGLLFDWLDALYDYENETDLYFEEVGFGTGEYGPVILYEYGAVPGALKSSPVRPAPEGIWLRTIRRSRLEKAANPDEASEELFRPLRQDAERELKVAPARSPRNTRQLRLTTTWLERIGEYSAAPKGLRKDNRVRAVSRGNPAD